MNHFVRERRSASHPGGNQVDGLPPAPVDIRELLRRNGPTLDVRITIMWEKGIKPVTYNDEAFTAIKADGSVVTWGSRYSSCGSSSVASLLQDRVVQVAGTNHAFAAIKADGSVVA